VCLSIASGRIIRAGVSDSRDYCHLPVPRDDVLKTSHMTREAFEKDKAEAETAIEKDFQGCSGGAYHITLGLPGFRHSSFTDLPLLRAAGNANGEAIAIHSLQLAEPYTLAFFDRFLKGAPNGLLDREPAKGDGVEISRYLPQAR
jgi:hypothetical protein